MILPETSKLLLHSTKSPLDMSPFLLLYFPFLEKANFPIHSRFQQMIPLNEKPHKKQRLPSKL
jgi:hypothetical protein